MKEQTIKSNGVNRRDFLKASAVVPAAVMAVNPAGVFAAGDDEIKVALIGAGGRGSGALDNFIAGAKRAGVKTKVVAIADVNRPIVKGCLNLNIYVRHYIPFGHGCARDR